MKVRKQIANINVGQVRIEKNNMPEGLYFFQLYNDYGIVGTRKLIIQ